MSKNLGLLLIALAAQPLLAQNFGEITGTVPTAPGLLYPASS